MSTELIKHTYREIEIVYVEQSDKWNFTVNGRERNLETLTKAKESIDRALDKEVVERPWKPFEAWYEHRYLRSLLFFATVFTVNFAANPELPPSVGWIRYLSRRAKEGKTYMGPHDSLRLLS